MKSLIYLVFILFFLTQGIAGHTQLKEVQPAGEWKLLNEVKYVGTAKASLKYMENGQDTTFLLVMRDDRYELKEFFSVRFEGTNGALWGLQQILLSFFEKENKKNKKYEKVFSLGDTMVHVQHYKKLTGASIMLSTKEGYILFTKGEVERLFGL